MAFEVSEACLDDVKNSHVHYLTGAHTENAPGGETYQLNSEWKHDTIGSSSNFQSTSIANFGWISPTEVALQADGFITCLFI